MIEHWSEYSRFFTALLVILNPFAALPIFLALCEGYTAAERRRVASLAALTVLAVLGAAALFGDSLLTAMGTSLASFRVGGGTVLLLMALAMLRAEHDRTRTTPGEQAEAEARESIAVVPLAIPLLAGPGAISAVVIEMHRSDAALHWLGVTGVILAACAVLWLALRLAEPLGRLLGRIGLNIATRLFGLILTAIAVEIMANGLRELFPVLAGAGG